MATLIVYYDVSHTPLDRILDALPAQDTPLVLSIDVGEGRTPLDPAGRSVSTVQVDARHEFADGYVSRAIKSNARYEGSYFLSAALSRPLIAELAARHARSSGADTIVHGFSGNDALRVATGLRVLVPELRVRTVQDLCGPPSAASFQDYTSSANLWGESIEGGVLSDPSRPAPAEHWDALPHADPIRIRIDFECGVPVALDGVRMDLADLIAMLTSIGRGYGAGRYDGVENGQVGLKTRAVYFAPAAAALVTAHEDLERFVCSRREWRVKRMADAEWCDAVYDGLWFDPVRTSLDRFIDGINTRVTGSVLVELSAGAARVVARQSPCALYDDTRAVHRAGQTFGSRLIDELAEQQSAAARLLRACTAGGSTCSA